MTQISDLVHATQPLRKKWNAATMQTQERAFTNWCNLFLKTKGFQIKSILDLQDGVCLLILLENISSKNFHLDVGLRSNDISRNWKTILELLEEENIHVTESPDSVSDVTRRTQIITFIVWRIILRFQICEEILPGIKADNIHYNRAPKRLMRWVQHMLPKQSMSNFNSDWTNGIALCHLVNAIRPGAIPGAMFADDGNHEINVRLACTTADDELGIPELLSPYEIANGMTEEKCMMIYLALFRSADKVLNCGTQTMTYADDPDMETQGENNAIIKESNFHDDSPGIPYQRQKCVAFGAGLRWGQVGRPSEFFVQVSGAEFADLSISIECRPFDNRPTHYKPNLQIKSLDKASYMVQYTPTRPGEYILNIFCSRQHIPNSPFRLSVQETVLKDYHEDEIMISFNPAKVMYTGSHILDSLDSVVSDLSKENATSGIEDSAFGDDDDLSSFVDSNQQSSLNNSMSYSSFVENEQISELSDVTKPACGSKAIRIYGEGLKSGEVGLVSSFQVCTPGSEKGPLTVGITCPAMSIPVPSVKTKLHATHMMHDIVYLPTEPGIYQIDVNWGGESLDGSPFYIPVGEIRKNSRHEKEIKDSKDVKETRISYYRPLDKHNLIIYYSATTGNTDERVNTRHLESLLREENPLDSLICITIDLELERFGRKKVFDKACTKKLPMVFVNDQYIGSFDDIMTLYNNGELKQFLLKCKDLQTGNIVIV